MAGQLADLLLRNNPGLVPGLFCITHLLVEWRAVFRHA
jgi:hypothetical protein